MSICKKLTILGGGVLGTQIALVSAYHGKDVTLWLRSKDSITRTQPKLNNYSKIMIQELKNCKRNINSPVGTFLYPRGIIGEWKNMTAEKIDKTIDELKVKSNENIHIELDMGKAAEDADIVIESMAEDPKAKINVYKSIKDLLPKKTILCTNSSSMIPSQFAQYTGRPEKYLALHFANNIWINNTTEIMGHAKTDKMVFNRVVEFSKEIGMIPLKLNKEQPGYILNSILTPFLIFSLKLLANDVSDPQTIDKTWELSTGAPRGPFKIIDVIGLETCYNVYRMAPDVKSETGQKVLKILKEKIDKGETGINAGKGFYNYKK